MERPLTVPQAAEALGYHAKHVYRLLRRGVMQGERFQGVWMIDRAEVERIKGLQSPKGRLPNRPPGP